MKRITAPVLLMSVFLLVSVAHGAERNAILGAWNTPNDKAKVKIFRCGDDFCGKIIALKQPDYPADDKQGMAGKPKVDRHNPDPALRSRPVCGLQIMKGFSYAGGDSWVGGRIYDPASGKTYKCKLKLATPHRLKVRGYIGISLFGRTETWTR